MNNDKLTGLDKLYMAQVKDLIYLIAPAVNWGIRIPEADSKLCRNIMDRIQEMHKEMLKDG